MRMESFTPREFDDERNIVLDELERLQTDPERVLARRVARDLWGAAWHGRDVVGDSASLSTLLDRDRAVQLREQVIGIGCEGLVVRLARARLRASPPQRG